MQQQGKTSIYTLREMLLLEKKRRTSYARGLPKRIIYDFALIRELLLLLSSKFDMVQELMVA